MPIIVGLGLHFDNNSRPRVRLLAVLDMARTVLNVIGNALAALVMSKWQGEFDTEKQKAYEVEHFANQVK